MKRSHDVLLTRAAPAYGLRILGGTVLLAGAAILLTIASIRFEVPFSGLAAVVVTFGGLTWLSIVGLRRRFAQFDLRRGTR